MSKEDDIRYGVNVIKYAEELHKNGALYIHKDAEKKKVEVIGENGKALFCMDDGPRVAEDFERFMEAMKEYREKTEASKGPKGDNG